jgi:hypothetical protein
MVTSKAEFSWVEIGIARRIFRERLPYRINKNLSSGLVADIMS